MRSYDPNSKTDASYARTLEATPFQLSMLKNNPPYTSWGNFEDSMSNKDRGWCSPVEINSPDELFGLDEMNELVNFYFELTRDNRECPHCEGSAANPATKAINEAWYSFDKVQWKQIDDGRRINEAAWQYKLTEVEVEALAKEGRLWDFIPRKKYRWNKAIDSWTENDHDDWIACEQPEYPTPEAVNEWAINGMGHDSINRWICVEARAKHLGVYGECGHCDDGRQYEGHCKLNLQMWMIHPRKGAARGVYLHDIKEAGVPRVIAYLKQAGERNANRFSNL